MKYLDLQKGKVFSVCMIHMWVTICLKLEKPVHLLSDCFPYDVLHSCIRNVKSCLLSWAQILKISICAFGPSIVLQSDVKVLSQSAPEENKRVLRYCHMLRMQGPKQDLVSLDPP